MEKAQPETMQAPTTYQGQGLLARLPVPIFWIVTVCISLIAGALFFFVFGILANVLNASDGVIFFPAVSGLLAGVIATIIFLRRRRRRGQELPVEAGIADIADPLPARERPKREPFFGNPRAVPSSLTPVEPEPKLAQADPEPKESPALPKLEQKEIIVIAAVAGIAILFFFSGGSMGGATGGVDGILGLVGSAVCNILAAIGAQSFMPEACPYNPVKAAHHLIVVFGAIFLIEELFRRFGSTSNNDTPSGT